MNDATLDNPAFARSAALAKSLFSPSNTAFAATAVLDLFDSEMQPLDVLDARTHDQALGRFVRPDRQMVTVSHFHHYGGSPIQKRCALKG